ncbi:MAG TPA: FtsX-like permease family protein [Bryobacteraceae bacterium]|nr:FtsX-like permease family protein [Bryobacteraceae bacterium]
MILLRLISWPYARKHLLRCLLTTAGIVLGVAVFVGMHTANQSVLAAFHQTIDRIAGSTQLQISAGEPGFDEDVLEKVQNLREVRAASPVLEATVSTTAGNLLILGVDMLGDRTLRTYDLEGTDDAIDDPLVFLAQPDSLIVTQSFARERNLKVNSKIAMRTMQGDETFTVRGIMKPGGLASAFGGNLAIMDVYSAQKVFGRGRKFDRVDIALQEGLTLEQGIAVLQRTLGPGFQIEPPSTRGQQFEATSHIYSLASNITSVFALFIGMFIIYNTFAIAVTQRRSEIGILRALGATRSQIRTLFLAESAIAGLAGTLAGVAFGILMARGMAGYIGGLLAEVYGIAQRADSITIDPRLIAVAIAMGVITSLIAAVIPARAAAGVDPVKALQKGRHQSLSEGENRTRRNLAIACAIASVLALVASHNQVIFYGGYMLAVITAVLLAPALSLWIARAIRPALAWMRPVEGALAADSLIQAPRRTSGTVAALMLSLALVISLSGLARASYNSLADWMRIALNPDLFVTTAETVTSRTFVFPAVLGEGFRAMPGVAEVQLVRSVRVMVKNTPIMLVAADIASLGRRAKLPPVEGDLDDMYRRAAAGEGVLASDNMCRLHGCKLGDILEIPAPTGILQLPVVGVVRDFSDQQGSLLIDRQLFIKKWNDDTVNIFRLYLTPGADEAAVRKTILEKYGSRQRLFVLTNKDLRDYILRLTDQWFGLTYVQIAVAVLVAVLGIVNALTVSITDRRRELGVLQAVGGLRNQVRRTIWMEAGAIGFIGLMLGLGLGAIQLYYTLEVSRRDLIGMDLGYAFPFQMALALVPVILGAAFLAALAPAETAVRGSLVEALEYE